MPISLSDDELDAVMSACKPLRPGDRDQFLRALAQELGREPQLGPGVIHRVARDLQRRFFDPPITTGGDFTSRALTPALDRLRLLIRKNTRPRGGLEPVV